MKTAGAAAKIAGLAFALFVLGFASGWMTRDSDLAFLDRGATYALQQEAQDGSGGAESTSAGETLPGEVSGEEVEGLPRYPSSTRTDYEQSLEDGLILTEAKFLADAGAEDVRHYYREAFDEGGWPVVDLDFSNGDWEYFILAGEREAIIEIEPQEGPGDRFVEIEFELSEPAETQASRGSS